MSGSGASALLHRTVARALVAALLAASLLPAPALAAPAVYVDGRPLRLEAAPRVEQGRTLVPLRGVFEALGAQVTFDPATQTVVAVRAGRTVILRVGSPTARVNGKQVDLEVPARVRDGRTLVPLRFVAEALGVTVRWDPAAGAVHIATGGTGAGAAAVLTAEQVAQLGLASTVLIETDGGLGSGFFVDDQGTVVTNHHVIAAASWVVVVTPDGKRHEATGLLASDPARDVAVLRTEARGYPALRLADGESLRPGQSVVAVGSPLGLVGSVSTGVVSSPNRVIQGIAFIQHTAPISPGNSGGPLLTLAGEVAGMNTMMAAGPGAQNVNFAVSAAEIRAVLEQGSAAAPRPLAGRPAPAAVADAAEFQAWLERTYRPARQRCADLFPGVDQAYDEARQRAFGAQACAHQLALETMLLEAPPELRGAQYRAFMGAAYLSAAAAAWQVAIELGARGDAAAPQVVRLVEVLQAAADEHLANIAAEGRGEGGATLTPTEYLLFILQGLGPIAQRCHATLAAALEAQDDGAHDQAAAQAEDAWQCYETVARGLLRVRWAPEDRWWFHFSLAMSVTIRGAEALALRELAQASGAGETDRARGVREAVGLLHVLADWYGQQADE